MCRMLIAVGEVNISNLIDDFVLIASDKNERHENNEDKDFPHGDGWGISYVEDNQIKLYKSIKPCYEDKTIHSFKKINSPLYLLHARRGSVGSVKMENVHPFQYLNYIFCHNGTVKEELQYDNIFTPQGDTDSERLFYYLLSNMNNGLDENIIYEKLSKVKNFMGMNCFVTDGNTRFIVNWYAKKKPNYYTFKVLKEEKYIIIASEILPHFKSSNWKKLENHDILRLNTLTKNYTKLSL